MCLEGPDDSPPCSTPAGLPAPGKPRGCLFSRAVWGSAQARERLLEETLTLNHSKETVKVEVCPGTSAGLQRGWEEA